MSWVKPVLEGGRLLLELIKVIKPKGHGGGKPGPDVTPIKPEDLQKPQS